MSTTITASQDLGAHTMTFTAEFDAPVDRVWQIWTDPRQLERWWGPPTWPATFQTLDLRSGGAAAYAMTGPDGERSAGYWDVIEVDPPRRLVFEDGFADADGAPDTSLPTSRSEVVLEDLGDGRTRMTNTATFGSTEQLEQLLEMGMREGMLEALGQVEGVLAA